jgi:putative endonuclease
MAGPMSERSEQWGPPRATKRVECPERAKRVEGLGDEGDGPAMSDEASRGASQWFVYILRCADGSYYVGYAADVEARVAVHNEGRGAAWTAAHRPVRLVYTEPHATEASAMAREHQIKAWSHEKKHALTKGDLDRLKRLSKRKVWTRRQ